jgi:PD-(D/E)XK nuclease superfamily
MTMQETDPLAPEKIEDAVPRDRWGRPVIKQPDGTTEAYTRCTTFVKALEGDASALALWKMRMTALGLNARQDLRMAVATAGDGKTPDSKKALNGIVEQAAEAAAASSAATIGTALHKFTERMDRGEPLGTVPNEFARDLQAYAEITAVLEAVQTEQFGVHDELKVAGTWDRLNRHQGRLYIGDVKTGRVDDLSIGKIAMQLSIYSRCKLYDPATGARHEQAEPVDQDRAIVIELPAGTGTARLWWVDIAAGWQAVQLAARARKWQRWAKMATLAEPFTMAQLPVPPQDGAPGDYSPQVQFIEPSQQPGQDPAPLAAVMGGAPLPPDDAGARALQQQQMAQVAQGGIQAPAVDAALLMAIQASETVEALMTLWNATGGTWGDEHKAAASRRRAELGG